MVTVKCLTKPASRGFAARVLKTLHEGRGVVHRISLYNRGVNSRSDAFETVQRFWTQDLERDWVRMAHSSTGKSVIVTRDLVRDLLVKHDMNGQGAAMASLLIVDCQVRPSERQVMVGASCDIFFTRTEMQCPPSVES